jgi:hypothetical protein
LSRLSYDVAFDGTDVDLTELMRLVHQSMTQTATPVGRERRDVLARLQWTPVSVEGFEGVHVPTSLFEVKLPNESTEDVGIKDEKALVSVGRHNIRITITDASLPSGKCDEVTVKVAQRIYEEAMGKPIPRSHILLRPTHVLSKTICECCLQPLDTFPYRCHLCGRCFCYDHKNPENHGCGVDRKITISEKPRVEKAARSRHIGSATRYEVVVQRVPCG